MAINMEDEIITNRLMYDGDNGTDIKLIDSILRTLLYVYNNKHEGDINIIKKSLLQNVEKLKLVSERSRSIILSNKVQQNLYTDVIASYNEKFSNLENNTNQSIDKLKQCKVLYEHANDYRLMSLSVNEFPTKDKIMKKIQQTKDLILELNKSHFLLKNRMDDRKKQLHCLSTILSVIENTEDSDL
ncbi:hypothetical protein A3Q56_07111 [Intoshia linei]|uniref:THO complex subunit 7 n=1 Tax=Intoshia linei TaxID=1819745 RepID=A0A177AUX1_9BILA|nr:hypothetical protein A3Q56_07111 [Intoshia linei]